MKIFSTWNISNPKNKPVLLASLVVGILFLLLLWAGFLRVWHLGGSSLWIDEGYTINAAQGIQKTGLPTLGSGKLYLAHAGSIYVTALSLYIGIFNPQNPWQARLPAAIFGILTILATYFFAYAAYKKRDIAVLAAFLVAFSFWELAWSRQARGYTQMQFFTLLSFGFFILWLRLKKITHGILALLFGIAAFVGQSVFIILVPVYMGLAVLSLTEGGNKKRWFFFVLIVTGIFLICGILSFLDMFSSSISFNFQPQYFFFLTQTYPILLLLVVFSLCAGFFDEKIRLPALQITLIIFLPLVILTFFSPTIQYRYLLTVFPFFLIQASTGLCIVIRYCFKKIISKHLLISYILIIGLGALLFNSYLNVLPYTRYQLESGSPQPAFNSAYAFIQSQKSPSDLVISPYADLTNIYLRKPGLLLPISLSGRSSEITGTTQGGVDYYTGAPALLDFDKFKTILETQSGFIVLDNMAENRTEKTYRMTCLWSFRNKSWIKCLPSTRTR